MTLSGNRCRRDTTDTGCKPLSCCSTQVCSQQRAVQSLIMASLPLVGTVSGTDYGMVRICGVCCHAWQYTSTMENRLRHSRLNDAGSCDCRAASKTVRLSQDFLQVTFTLNCVSSELRQAGSFCIPVRRYRAGGPPPSRWREGRRAWKKSNQAHKRQQPGTHRTPPWLTASGKTSYRFSREPRASATPKDPEENRSMGTRSSSPPGKRRRLNAKARARLVQLGKRKEECDEERRKTEAAQDAIGWRLKELTRRAQGLRLRRSDSTWLKSGLGKTAQPYLHQGPLYPRWNRRRMQRILNPAWSALADDARPGVGLFLPHSVLWLCTGGEHTTLDSFNHDGSLSMLARTAAYFPAGPRPSTT